MNRRLKITIFTVMVLVLLFMMLYAWYQGTPYQERFHSPNKAYYVQKYKTLSLNNFRVAMPGQGSDSVDGFIRLYNQQGNLLHQRYETFIRDIEPVWSGQNIFLMGVEEMDNNPWVLPSSSTD